MSAAPGLADTALEAPLLGAVLVGGPAAGILATRGLQPDHFYFERHRHVWSAILAQLNDADEVDTATVDARLRSEGISDRGHLDGMAAQACSVGLIGEYARRVMRAAEDRRVALVLTEMHAALAAGDHGTYGDLEADLETRLPGASGRRIDLSPDDLASMFIDQLEGAPVRRYRYPFQRLNRLSKGGARAGNVVLVMGPTSFGKSAWLDFMLDSMAADAPGGVRLYLNEMEPEERMNRIVARRSGVTLDHIERAASGGQPLDPERQAAVLASLVGQPIRVTPAAGWTMQQIVRHARKRDDDIIALDILNRLPRKSANRTAELEEASGLLDELAKTTGKLVVVVAHINRGRLNHDGTYPMTTLNDLKDCMQLGNDCDHAIVVWREQDRATADPTETAVVRFVKCRGGERGGVECVFDGSRQRFIETPVRHLREAA